MESAVNYQPPFRIRCRRCGAVGLFATGAGLLAADWFFHSETRDRLADLLELSYRGANLYNGICATCWPAEADEFFAAEAEEGLP
jgi:hypothetical protein